MKKTMIWRVNGAEGHRMRESFSPSRKFNTWDEALVEVYNSDVTGTNDYSIVRITAENVSETDLEAQISDGIFENCRVGSYAEITEEEFEQVCGK